MSTAGAAEALTLDGRHVRLRHILQECGSVCVGYSGGVDSALLAVVAVRTLGVERVLAVTGRSAAYPDVQRQVALDCARRFGIPHLEIATDELQDANYRANPSNRCYFCKSELWPKLSAVARSRGLAVVLDGSNADDAHDYRPGFAAAREHHVRSPLLEVGLSKDDVRALSRTLGLPTWDQPSAPCLSSRLPYGIAVTEERLRQVEQAERALRSLGFRELRVRHHDDCVRIELAPSELAHAARAARAIHERIGAIGPELVLLDVEGYRRGALNEVLVQLGATAPAHSVATDDSPAQSAATDTPPTHSAPTHTLPPHRAAGLHRDIAVLTACDLATARAHAAQLRALGYRYIALDLATVSAQVHDVVTG